MEKISSIYQIQSKRKPERIYIGSAVNIKHRWGIHLSDLKLNKHHSIKTQEIANILGTTIACVYTQVCKLKRISRIDVPEELYVTEKQIQL